MFSMIIVVKSGKKYKVIDGAHRSKALQELMMERPERFPADFKVQVHVHSHFTRSEEIAIAQSYFCSFYLINVI